MKKIITLIATLLLTVTCVFGLTACGDNQKYVATEIAGIADEEFGFVVGKTSSNKANILAKMNEVIDEVDMEKIVTYYTEISEDKTPTETLQFANLNDNTAGTLKVYTNSGFEPYEFTDASNKIVGVDIYLMELVAEKLNMKISVVDMDFDGICGKVATEDNAVGAAGITINDERKATVDFSNPYYSSVQCIISKDNDVKNSLAGLAGKKIGVQKGTTGAQLVSEAIENSNGALYGTGATVIEYDNGAVAFAAMKQGKCDYVVIDKLPAQKLASNK